MDCRFETTLGALDLGVVAQLTQLDKVVKQYDAVAAFGETTWQAILAGQAGVSHVLAWVGERVVAYAQANRGLASGEAAVHPAWRNQTIGRTLISQLQQTAPALHWWAHGDLPAARAVAKALSLVKVRQMLKMGSCLSANLARQSTPPPAGTIWRLFDPVVDRAAWLELNAVAFAGHREQGQLTGQDLDWRLAQDWYDPAGFFLAETTQPGQPNQLVGYHWTKVKNGVGEVYGIAVHPKAQGQGLGTALLKLGLEFLARAGINQVELYVEADNTPAIAAYQRQGFMVAQRHVQYAKTS